MGPDKSQEQYILLIAQLLRDVQTLHSDVITPRALRLTTLKVEKRYAREGMGFLSKTLPRIGKALDRALSSDTPLAVPFEQKLKGTQLPRFLGELFSRVFDIYGMVLPTPCVRSIRSIRQVCYLFYKLKLPYTADLEQTVVDNFIVAERDVAVTNTRLQSLKTEFELSPLNRCCPSIGTARTKVLRRARVLLSRALSKFDPKNIQPRHGPGSVSTGERLWGKWYWSNVPDRVLAHYPLDEYFYASLGHVAYALQELKALGGREVPAKVILVPKDSRGPRLISCEPLYLQWIQQGISRALVHHIEHNFLTKEAVHFTDQQPNQFGALLGSREGKYATLDLKEASDRIGTGLVHLLFPQHIVDVLMATRSLSTVLPDGKEIQLNKFAPMGSALCFPILALSIWAILAAAAPDAYTRERILVYGDDVIVPTAFAANAIEQLEYFGLLINRDKSCISGLFRESCGVDAYMATDVTPIRFRTGWSSSPRPDHLAAWVSYANSCYKAKYFNTYDFIVRSMYRVYRNIPEESLRTGSPSFIEVPDEFKSLRRRMNSNLQRFEYLVVDVTTRKEKKTICGYKMLLRYFSEHNTPRTSSMSTLVPSDASTIESGSSVGLYTKRRDTVLKLVWR